MKPGLASAAIIAMALSIAALLAAWLWEHGPSLREANPGGGGTLAGEFRPAEPMLVNSPD